MARIADGIAKNELRRANTNFPQAIQQFNNDLGRTQQALQITSEPTDVGNDLPTRGSFPNNTVLDSDVQNSTASNKSQLMRSRTFIQGTPAYLLKAKVSPSSAVATAKLK
jgi:hypothetical protein